MNAMASSWAARFIQKIRCPTRGSRGFLVVSFQVCCGENRATHPNLTAIFCGGRTVQFHTSCGHDLSNPLRELLGGRLFICTQFNAAFEFW